MEKVLRIWINHPSAAVFQDYKQGYGNKKGNSCSPHATKQRHKAETFSKLIHPSIHPFAYLSIATYMAYRNVGWPEHFPAVIV